MKKILLLLFLSSQLAFGQKLSKADKAIIENLKFNITYLSSDELEGRRTGTKGEKLAYEYIANQFEKIGLLPKGVENTYFQPFEINEGKQILPTTRLSINGEQLETGVDYFPFVFSKNGELEAEASPAIQEKGSPWFFDIEEFLSENKNNPHLDLDEFIKKKAIQSSEKGATALIVYNSGKEEDSLFFNGNSKTNPVTIPVLFLTKKTVNKYLGDNSVYLDFKIRVDIGDKKRTGNNVIGYLDNGAAHTIIIGAHYDHLGYGEDHNSLWLGKPTIHNGADDNASGTAGVIELARMLKKSKLKNHNYLFICFSGEELGLYGSKYFTNNPTIQLKDVNYMINSDMIGRLNDSLNTLNVGGYGTSPSWSNILPATTKELKIRFDSSGIGPSDHTSFYLKDIPVLFFFTGIHSDYHKPTDDVDKINFIGQFRVIQYIYNILEHTNKLNKLVFTKTREPQINVAHFSVTLGIMPDYTYSGKGVRADGIIEGKIAQKGGMLSGDIITQLGGFEVSDIYSYMDILSKFKKGDATTCTFLRGKESKTIDIIF